MSDMVESLRNKKLIVIGLMSGTSMDGIDCALLQTPRQNKTKQKKKDGETIKLQQPNYYECYEYSREFKERLKKILGKTNRTEELTSVETELTRQHMEAVKKFLRKYRLSMDDIDLISFHGHTIYHESKDNMSKAEKKPHEIPSDVIIGRNCASWQIGNGALLSKLTGKPVVYNLRKNDIVHGGQGCPLVPLYHAAIAKYVKQDHPMAFTFPVVFVNIGGVANVTYVDVTTDKEKGSIQTLIAFDCGPGNAILDDFVTQVSGNRHSFDPNGLLYCYKGIHDIRFDVVNKFLQHKFTTNNLSSQGLPKSLDRNQWHSFIFNLLKNYDNNNNNNNNNNVYAQAATIAECTVQSIVHSVDYFGLAKEIKPIPKTWLLCGGGRHNRFFKERIHTVLNDKYSPLLRDISVLNIDDFGLNGDAVEAQCWAS
ncbi:hypothetical protein RFI_02801 [Reticulomyxa filosa]|uniref:Anhydro-N-acetylmuramic acid kinase n=1 Tax=Reticulomyxa filosa TaxID=46433 RepID=X6P6W8_RETFI|nr:hypothetical protein RFI_02801 [Reticulomyxa filosa]|eukprot:ETO34290.1 hypothetical protein RFI_02801 [Reticulomyxa filosa]